MENAKGKNSLAKQRGGLGKFCLDFPIKRPHCGIPMGNGRFGALLWGDETLNITVNRVDFWDRRGGELIVPGTSYRSLVEAAARNGSGPGLSEAILRNEFPQDVFKPQRLPVGRFELSFAKGVRPLSASIDYSSGTVAVKLSNSSELLADMSLRGCVMLLRDPSGTVASVAVKTAFDFRKSREWLVKYAFQEPDRIKAEGVSGWVQACPVDPSLASLCAMRDGSLAIALELGRDNAEALANAKHTLASIDEAKLLEESRTWWQGYWHDAVELELPDSNLNRFFKHAIYKFGAATHPSGCACPLQGPWQEEYQRASWSGDYHFNVNVQQVYSLAFSIGRLEHLLPLFDMIESESFQAAMKHNAKVMFGIDDAFWMTHAVDDRGWQCGWLVTESVLDPGCGAWTAQLYWLYYKHSGDKDFLARRAMPFMAGIMRGYEAMMEELDGRLSIPLAVSAEYGCGDPRADRAGRDPSYQLAAAHMLADMLIEASEDLGLAPKPAWLDIKKRLPVLSVIDAHDVYGRPETRIAIWKGQDLAVCHRHHSHLAGIYPFQTFDNLPQEYAELLDNSIDRWIALGMGLWSEWCIPWAAIICSRLGFHDAPAQMLCIWHDTFVNEGLATVYIPRSRGVIAHRRHDLKLPKEENEVMQLDGTMGAATAMIEMMAHMRAGTLRLFQGVAEKWRDASFKNIRLSGGFVASAVRSDGKLRSLTLKSERGGSISVDIDGSIQELALQPGEERTIDLNS